MRKNFIAIGSFDGVHLGHRHLFESLKDLAAEHKMTPLLLVFKVPPKVVMDPSAGLLSTPEEKAVLLKKAGIRHVEFLDFKKVRDLSKEEFFNILLKKYNMGGILCGKDFAFGKERGGKAYFLKRACAENGVIFNCADFLETGGVKISSSLIRKSLKSGDIEAVNDMLGAKYEVSGKIVKGRQMGRKIGFPTANIDFDKLKILPRGVYAVKAKLGRKEYMGVCNIGCRPTVEQGGLPTCEVHILDFNRDIYGRVMTAEFVAKIRAEKKFATLGELTQQINRDSILAYKLLK